jgi:hypothetical protein
VELEPRDRYAVSRLHAAFSGSTWEVQLARKSTLQARAREREEDACAAAAREKSNSVEDASVECETRERARLAKVEADAKSNFADSDLRDLVTEDEVREELRSERAAGLALVDHMFGAKNARRRSMLIEDVRNEEGAGDEGEYTGFQPCRRKKARRESEDKVAATRDAVHVEAAFEALARGSQEPGQVHASNSLEALLSKEIGSSNDVCSKVASDDDLLLPQVVGLDELEPAPERKREHPRRQLIEPSNAGSTTVMSPLFAGGTCLGSDDERVSIEPGEGVSKDNRVEESDDDVLLRAQMRQPSNVNLLATALAREVEGAGMRNAFRVGADVDDAIDDDVDDIILPQITRRGNGESIPELRQMHATARAEAVTLGGSVRAKKTAKANTDEPKQTAIDAGTWRRQQQPPANDVSQRWGEAACRTSIWRQGLLELIAPGFTIGSANSIGTTQVGADEGIKGAPQQDAPCMWREHFNSLTRSAFALSAKENSGMDTTEGVLAARSECFSSLAGSTPAWPPEPLVAAAVSWTPSPAADTSTAGLTAADFALSWTAPKAGNSASAGPALIVDASTFVRPASGAEAHWQAYRQDLTLRAIKLQRVHK